MHKKNKFGGEHDSHKDGKPYSLQDDAEFEKLMDFPRSPVTDAAQSEKVDTKQPGPIIVYSESDIEAFDRLQVIADKNKSSVCKNPASTGVSFTMEGYSDSDNSQFNELAENLEGLQQLPINGFVAQEIKAEPVGIDYSQADNQAFNRLMREGLDDAAESDTEPDPTEQTGATSQIKIIDFDEERSREKSRVRQGQIPVKIRYFD